MSNEIKKIYKEMNLQEVTEGILFDTRQNVEVGNALSIPITELSSLGSLVASIVPAVNKVMDKDTSSFEGLYRIANFDFGDTLKIRKQGNFWPFLKKANGTSVYAQLQSVEPSSLMPKCDLPISPTTVMMAAILYSISVKVEEIAALQKEILSFLEMDKESEIEADLETLMNLVDKYKFNLENEHFITSNHKMVLDIQRTARKNINMYQKKVNEAIKQNKWIVNEGKLNSSFKELEKNFKYYRLSLYTYSFASMVEIMLSGNFSEEYILGIKDEIKIFSSTYRDLFSKCSIYLEKMSSSALDLKVMKNLGKAGQFVGNLIGKIPVVKDGVVDDLLQNSGDKLQEGVINKERSIILEFANISNPNTYVFIEKMEDMIQIYNHTSGICFDKENIYLLND